MSSMKKKINHSRVATIILLLTMLLLTQPIFSQREKEIQMRIGIGLGAFTSTIDWTYKHPSFPSYNDKYDETFRMKSLPIEVRYELSERFNVGADIVFDTRNEIVDEELTGTDDKSNSYGIAVEYNILNKPHLRFFAGLHLSYCNLELDNNVYIGPDMSYSLLTYWNGAGVKVNLGFMAFIKQSPFGIHFNIGIDGRQMQLTEITFGDEKQGIEGTTATIQYSGIDANVGIVFRIRR